VDNTTASAQVSLTVNPAATSTTLTSSAPSTDPGSSVTFTATVASAVGAPPGNVTFLDSTTALATVTLNSGAASFSTSALSAGTHSITATYPATTNFSSSVSAVIPEIIASANFSLSASLPPPVPSGQNIDVPITVTPSGGISGQVQFSVTGLPPRSSASFTPSALTLGANPAIDTLVVLTTPRFDYLSQRVAARSRALFAGLFWFPFAGLFAGGAGLAWRRNRRGARCFILLSFLIGFGLLAGCAGSGNFQNAGTPAGTYALTVTAAVTTAAGITTHSTIVTITVR
jgi:hypothetical protein